MNDSQFSQILRDKSLTEGCVRCNGDEKEHNGSYKEAQAP